MGVRLRFASVRGPAHVAAGLPNQDAVLVRRYRAGWFAAVSDGMGSRSRADVGAKVGCWAGWQSVRCLPFDSDDSDWVELVQRLWLERLSELQVHPEDAVATCLLAWGQVDGQFRLAQLGDGLILGQPEPREGLVKRDANGFSNETRGLGLSCKNVDWRFLRGTLRKPGDGLVLMTDGISDDLDHIDGLAKSVIAGMRGRGGRSARAALTRELEDWPTPLHGDDKTIALVYQV